MAKKRRNKKRAVNSENGGNEKRRGANCNSLPIIWAIHLYRCQICFKDLSIQVAQGVDGPRDEPWVESPMYIPCQSLGCDGEMVHAWEDEELITVLLPRQAGPGCVFVPNDDLTEALLINLERGVAAV